MTSEPKAIKHIPKIIVVTYPILKSKIISFLLINLSFFFFSKVQIDCQIEISSGAGIQPIKATKKAISIASFGKICVNSNELLELVPAINTANKVLTVSNTITNFIKLSRSLYLPIKSISKHIKIIIHAQTVILDVIPKSSIANPAVTIVTAV